MKDLLNKVQDLSNIINLPLLEFNIRYIFIWMDWTYRKTGGIAADKAKYFTGGLI